MSKALLSSIMSFTISFPFVMFAFDFLVFAQALHRCLSLAKTFSTFTENGRSSAKLFFFSVSATHPILLNSANV